MSIVAGAKLDAQDLSLPDAVSAHGNGSNTLSTIGWGALPTTPVSASILNPHPSATMLCLISYGAWLSSSTTNDVRIGLDVSGALTIAPGVGGGAALNWGEIPTLYGIAANQSKQATIPLELPPGTTTFKVYGWKTSGSTGNQVVSYPTLRIVPVRFSFV